MTNEYGVKLDRNGYAPSIMQQDTEHCYLCGCCDQKLDRHEAFRGPYRTKSKNYGLWVTLCHERCHFGAVHRYYSTAWQLMINAQQAAMAHYGWTAQQFRDRFGKSWIDDEE